MNGKFCEQEISICADSRERINNKFHQKIVICYLLLITNSNKFHRFNKQSSKPVFRSSYYTSKPNGTNLLRFIIIAINKDLKSEIKV